MRTLARTMLGELGFANVEAAADGDEAYRKFLAQPASLVITDLSLDAVDGIELVRRIRTESPNPFVPIIMLSGEAELDAVLRARDAGANDFLVKPVSIDTLYTHLYSVLAHRRSFVKSETYFGPDRRHRAKPTGGKWDRRRARLH